jgi:hypothetical protein
MEQIFTGMPPAGGGRRGAKVSSRRKEVQHEDRQ